MGGKQSTRIPEDFSDRLDRLVANRFISKRDRDILNRDPDSSEYFSNKMQDKSDHDLAVVIRWYTQQMR